jgi:tight adherence protein B
VQPARHGARRRLLPRRRFVLAARLQAHWQRVGAERRLVDELPNVLDDVARGLRAGSSLRQSCAAAAGARGRAGAELGAVVRHAERGAALPAAFRAWAERSTTPELRLTAAALALAAAAGGPQARAVDGVATTLRERRAIAAEVRAQSAQARLSALVIGLLPVAFMVWALATDRRTAAFLVSSPPGWACLLAGLGLEAGGVLWMRRILRGAAP